MGSAGNNLQALARWAPHRGRIFQHFVIQRRGTKPANLGPSMTFPLPAWLAAVFALSLASAAAAPRRRRSDPHGVRRGRPRRVQQHHRTRNPDSLGVVEYVQHRKGDILEAKRVAYFADGSSDEDSVEAKVGKTLRAVRGHSIIRDTSGRTTVDMRIDVAKGVVTGFYGLDKDRKEFDEHGDIPQGTYFGPPINLVLKNFDANAERGRLVFHTIVPTPGPRQLDMEVIRQDPKDVPRPGHDIQAVGFMMRPTVNPILNPIVHMIAPETHFFLTPTQPPALGRFEGPRNYAGQSIRIE